jgi:hypothetical protein
MNIRYLKNLRRVEYRDPIVGRWVIELSFEIDRSTTVWDRRLRFGVYKVLRHVPENRKMVYQKNIKGFYREYLIWLPWVRVE